MVGVPGRSKGCITCRRRKKGCDKQIPRCNRCARAGLTCEGYEQDLVWLNSTTSSSSGEQSVASCQSKAAPDIRPWVVSYAKKKDSNAAGVTLHSSFANSAREQLYLGLFWSLMIPNGSHFSSESESLSSIGWTRYIGQLYNSETALRYATVATAASVIGRANQDAQLCLKGLQVYNWTLQEMVKAIKQPDRAKGDGLIAAARILALYELLFGREGSRQLTGWRRHGEGQLAMFLSRGPESFQSGASHQLFKDSRINMIALATNRRIASPFSTHAWKTIPWTHREKSTADKLMDIMDDIPDLILQVDAIEQCVSAPATHELRSRLRQQCRDMEAALATWERRVDLSIYDYTVAGPCLPVPKNDADFSLLHLSCVYWKVCLKLYLIMDFVTRPADCYLATRVDVSEKATSTDRETKFAVIPHSESSSRASSANPSIYASKIAHCAHLFFEPPAGVVQGGSGLFPIGAALRFLEITEVPGQESKDAQMLRDVFGRPFLGSWVEGFFERFQGTASSGGQQSLGDAKDLKLADKLRLF